MPVDYDIADFLRRRAKQVLLVVNKVDGPNWESNATEFYGLGFEDLLTVSAEHKRGTSELIDQIISRIEHIEPSEEWLRLKGYFSLKSTRSAPCAAPYASPAHRLPFTLLLLVGIIPVGV